MEAATGEGRIRSRTYKTREEARQDEFDPFEMFCNPVRTQVRNGMLSPIEFERQQILEAEGVGKTGGNQIGFAAPTSVAVEGGRLSRRRTPPTFSCSR